jgi:hypothetical protein
MSTANDEPDPIAPLVASLQSADGDARRTAALTLARIGREAASAVPVLVAGLRDRDVAARAAIANALVGIGPSAVTALIEALREEDLDFRHAVLVTLGKMGPDAASAIPLLADLQEDEQVGSWAAEALARIRPVRLAGVRRWFGPRAPWVVGSLAGAVAAFVVAMLLAPGEGPLAPREEAALTAGMALALLGAGLGSLVGGSRWGGPGAIAGAVVCGLGGGTAGAFLGGLIGAVLEPLNRVLHQR